MIHTHPEPIPPLIADAVKKMKKQGLLSKDFVPRRVDAKPEPTPEEEEKMVSQILNREELFRFAYVPFVIAALVWDYLDTILYYAAYLRIQPVKQVCRLMKQLKIEYDRIRAPFVDMEHQNSEQENMLVFEEGVKEIMSLYLVNLKCDLASEYPELEQDYRDYLLAIYECKITLDALLRYTRKQEEIVAKRVGYKIDHILPKELYRVAALLPIYIGDKPISPRFQKQQETYISTFATQMALIGFNDIPDNKER